MKPAGLLALFALILIAAAGNALAANIFVSTGGSGTACTQKAPCTLDEAIDNQAAEGDNIYLAGGTYTTTGLTMYALPGTVVMRGGWDGTTTKPPVVKPDANVSILDGVGLRRVLELAPGAAALLDGLTIRNGYHNTRGACIYGESAVLVLRNCKVRSCRASSGSASTTEGGGVYLSDYSTLWVRDSIFTQNSARCVGGGCETLGGAIYLDDPENVEIKNTVFDRNDAVYGGALAVYNPGDKPDVSIHGSSFESCGRGMSISPITGQYGGAVYLGSVQAEITDTLFDENEAIYNGGGLFASSSVLNMNRCTFRMNRSQNTAGAYLTGSTTFDLENVFFSQGQFPSAVTPTSGIWLAGSASGSIKHSTIIGRAGEPQGTGIRLTGSATMQMENTIIVSLDTGVFIGGGLSVTGDGILWGLDGWTNDNNFVMGGGSTFTRTAEFTGNPAFKDVPNHDYRLSKNSPARDAGVASTVKKDMDRIPRDSHPDIGAWEYTTGMAVGMPSAGEIVPAGHTYNPTWTGPDKAKSFTFKYSTDNGSTWETIQKNVTGRSIDWKVPKVWTSRKKSLFKVIGYNSKGNKVGSAVSRKFTIAPLSVRVPEKGNEMDAGDTEPIYWETYATKKRVDQVIVKYTGNGGSTWKKVTPRPDKFDPWLLFWELPTPGATRDKCRIKVILKSKTGQKLGTAATEGWFSIAVPAY